MFLIRPVASTDEAVGGDEYVGTTLYEAHSHLFCFVCCKLTLPCSIALVLIIGYFTAVSLPYLVALADPN